MQYKGNGECANDMYSQPGGGSNSTVVPTTQNPNPSARNANPRQPHSPNTPGTPGALAGPSGGFVTAPFFAEQLTAFEVWLELGVQQGKGEESEPPRPPEQVSEPLFRTQRASLRVHPPPHPPLPFPPSSRSSCKYFSPRRTACGPSCSSAASCRSGRGP